ncbi:hypothetical protein BV25DRAFT_1762315, partial [Artomyces pyxidatus]
PAFLYASSTYDPDNADTGLLRSELLVHQHIFDGPSTTSESKPGKRRTKRGQSKIHGLKRVTARTIAYSATLERWNLSPADDWRMPDAFEYQAFFDAVVDILEDNPDTAWCEETLAWWNR